MTRRSILALGALVVSQITWSPAAWAQRLPDNTWSHGTTFDVFAGATTSSSVDTRGTLGAAVGWEITHRVSLEGAGIWVAATRPNEAFAAELKTVVNLTRPSRFVPFLAAGVGLYRASFASTSGTLPDFYQRRLTGPSTTHPTFTDPSLVFAGGVDVFTGQHFSIRPDLSVRLVTRASDAYPVTMAAVHVTYHFEVHDVQ